MAQRRGGEVEAVARGALAEGRGFVPALADVVFDVVRGDASEQGVDVVPGVRRRPGFGVAKAGVEGME